MKRFNLEKILPFLRSTKKSGPITPNVIWKMIVYGTVISIVTSAFLGAYFYKWVSVIDGSVLPTKAEKDVMSADEIRAILTVYKNKQMHFQELLSVRPVAPGLDKESGIDLDITDISNTSENVFAEPDVSTTTATSSE